MTSPNGTTCTSRISAAYNWTSVTYGTPNGVGLFVAVSTSGTGNRVMTSPDGFTWTSRTSAADNNWREVVYGTPNGIGLFVAVADLGTVMTSPDGFTWTSRTSTYYDYNWYSVTYGNGLFVAVSYAGKVMISPDGINWSLQNSPTNNNWESITYGNGLFVAVASSTGTTNSIMTATTLSPTITNFSIPTKLIGDVPFTITPPTSNSSGLFSYTSSNLLVATVLGNTITINGLGTSIITASQSATFDYTAGTIDVSLNVVQATTPTITDFSFNTQIYGVAPFTITQPQSNSDGSFSYSSLNTNVATITNVNTINIVGVGNSIIRAIQDASGNYSQGTIDASLNVIQSTPINPTEINTGYEFDYFMETTSEYGNITNTSITISGQLLSQSNKTITTNNTTTILLN